MGLHYHRYGFVESKAFTYWRAGDLLASFVDVAVPSLARPGPIWAAVRRQASPPAAALATPVRFVVELTIGGAHPSLSRGLADQVKPALDGVISAFHTHRGETEVVSERLASSGVGERDELGLLLHDPAWNVLGSRTVVRPFGATGVQWNPADDLCVAATVQPANVEPAGTAPRWRLTGKIHKAEPK